jgi:hypothetical protein
VDPTFNKDVTISLPGGSGATDTVQAQHGVATFAGLELDASANGGVIQAAGGGLPPAGTNPIPVTPPIFGRPIPSPLAPTIIGEQIVTMRKKNKKGKPVGKAVLMGFTLDYSTAMNPSTAGLAANYQVTSTTTKRVKKKTVTIHTPVALTGAAYNPSTNSVTLNIPGNPKFAKGGAITVIYAPPNGVSSVAGVFLEASDAQFTISPKATSIAPG